MKDEISCPHCKGRIMLKDQATAKAEIIKVSYDDGKTWRDTKGNLITN